MPERTIEFRYDGPAATGTFYRMKVGEMELPIVLDESIPPNTLVFRSATPDGGITEAQIINLGTSETE